MRANSGRTGSSLTHIISGRYKISSDGFEMLTAAGASYGGLETAGTDYLIQMRVGGYNLYVNADEAVAGTNTDFRCHNLIGRTAGGFTWVQLLGEQGAAVASPTADVTSLKTAVDAILSRMETHGLIAT